MGVSSVVLLVLICSNLCPSCAASFTPLGFVPSIPTHNRIWQQRLNEEHAFVSHQPGLKRPVRSPTSPPLTVCHGIPKMFRWLVDLYPVVAQRINDGLRGRAMAVDNFYLDMNGIIHMCTHSNTLELNEVSDEEMFQRIFVYTDSLYKLVRPKKLLYLAVDGVAPRAKMNQQRSRRFRSSKEHEAFLAEYVAREGQLPEDPPFDSNCITPGTDFMYKLGIAFREWIEFKMRTDSVWREGAKVIFSGPDVPGEGEHKVMEYIRRARETDPSWEPNMRHCMYGLDADLIMLSLVTHENYFVLLREKMSTRRGSQSSRDVLSYGEDDFELLEVSILRKLLGHQFKDIQEGVGMPPSFKFNLERIIDDFVFMCFFVGNDFLPHLPHMDIADGALNMMLNTYRDMLPTLGGYLTDKDNIHLARLELFIQECARRERLYFSQRAVEEKDPRYASSAYKDHYYNLKLNITGNDVIAKRELVSHYIRGLYWVLRYYHKGMSEGSWGWYYPYLYAPVATDLTDLSTINVTFTTGVPFTPLLQLISVLPPQSAEFLPAPYRDLMTDPQSPVVHYYPKDFGVDPNGKKNAWESIVQIPFIQEHDLLEAASSIDHLTLSAAERKRNIAGREHLYVPPKDSVRPLTPPQDGNSKPKKTRKLPTRE